MEQTTRYTLGKNERLKSRKAIDQLFTAGKSFSVFPFKVIWQKLPANLPAGQAGDQRSTINASLQTAFSVSKRHFKKATDRNRIKRLMRESYRLQKNELQQELVSKDQSIVVFILYIGNELPGHELVFLKMTTVIKRLQKTINENSNT